MNSIIFYALFFVVLVSGIGTETHNQSRPNTEYCKNKVNPELVDDDVSTTKGEKSQTEYAKESTSKISDIKFSTSKHKIFTKKQNKCAKTVPPLRIKLKQSMNKVKKDRCISKSNQRSKELSLKVVKTIDEKRERKDTLTNREQRDLQDSPLESSEKEVTTPPKNKKKKEKARKWYVRLMILNSKSKKYHLILIELNIIFFFHFI